MRFNEKRECLKCGEIFESTYTWDAHDPEATIEVDGAKQENKNKCPKCDNSISKRSTKRLEILS